MTASSSLALFGFDPAFLQKLERLTINNRQATPGISVGRRRSPRHGSSVELSDFRDYTPGDDIRHVDWNAYARLERLFLRLYSAEETTRVTLLLDQSTSMGFGTPSKSLTAGRIAAVLAYIALRNYDQVAVGGWSEAASNLHPTRTGRASIPAAWRAIADVVAKPEGATDFQAIGQHAKRLHGAGLTVVFSDFLTDSNWEGAIRALIGRAQDIAMVQILAREELEPSLRGDWSLRDSENEREVEVTVSSRLLKRYQEELDGHTLKLQTFARRHGATFVQVPNDLPLDDIVLKLLPRVRLLES